MTDPKCLKNQTRYEKAVTGFVSIFQKFIQMNKEYLQSWQELQNNDVHSSFITNRKTVLGCCT